MIYVTVNYRIIPYLNALCCVVSSNPFKPRTRLARDQSKSDSPDLSAPVARCSVTALNCFLRLFHERRRSINDARSVAPHYPFSRLQNFPRSLFLPTFPSLLVIPFSGITVERRYPRAIGHFIQVETRRVQLFWTMARQQGTTAASRFEFRGRGEKFCIFTRSSAPIRPCITHQPPVLSTFCSPFSSSCNDNLYEKYFSPFAAPFPARIASEMSAKKPWKSFGACLAKIPSSFESMRFALVKRRRRW